MDPSAPGNRPQRKEARIAAHSRGVSTRGWAAAAGLWSAETGLHSDFSPLRGRRLRTPSSRLMIPLLLESEAVAPQRALSGRCSPGVSEPHSRPNHVWAPAAWARMDVGCRLFYQFWRAPAQALTSRGWAH